MSDETKNAIEKFKVIRELLDEFSSREEAIKYLVKETGLSKKECSKAYDLIIRIDFSEGKKK